MMEIGFWEVISRKELSLEMMEGRGKVPQLMSVSLCISHQMVANISVLFH